MLAIRLDKEIEEDLDLLAKARGSNRSALVREAILQYLEDNEDLDLLKQAQSQTRGSKPLKQLRRELGLDS
jgi:RHH-type transcriptional regulator, rel operon repressor / antitoxin RelB